eukprot:g43792.t1
MLICQGIVEIKKEVVLFLLKSIKVDKSPRPNGICLSQVPEHCRVANVVPLFKNVNRDNPRNYRPVTKVIHEGRAVDVVYMDFRKAFDKVPLGRLIQKIKMCGIHSDLATWIQNWLADRRQKGGLQAG